MFEGDIKYRDKFNRDLSQKLDEEREAITTTKENK
jgi:hypothetical protein